MENPLYETDMGEYYIGKSEKLLKSELGKKLHNKVQLILTSPPFPLNKKKRYGNLQGDEYKNWFIGLSEICSELLTDDGSIVIEIGNSWVPGKPIQSLLHLESLIGFVNNPKANLMLCQEFICHNPSRLPSPAQWVTIERIRMIDSFTHIWWMSKSERPKADNRKVLRPYSKSMKNLLKTKKYNSGTRPSEHKIGERSFLNDNGGSIMPNVIEIEQIDENKEHRLPTNIFSIANTASTDFYHKTCNKRGLESHPAKMPLSLADFFIEFLTDSGDLVLDPFAGSNTTGFCAEKSNRKWISIEAEKNYGLQSMIRFEDPSINSSLKVNKI